jgi:DNA-binding CsgD family transcriptional regulator
MDNYFERIQSASDEVALLPLIKEAAAAWHAEWFVFASLHPVDQSVERSTHRFLIGCRPEWCQLYNANRWYLTDPCLHYARCNTLPVQGSHLPLHTAGQRKMIEVAADYGFRSAYIVPAHASDKGRIGVLYLGSSEAVSIGEPKLREGRAFFRLLALELLDWSCRSYREEVLTDCGLTERELLIAAYVKDGFNADQIARELNVSATTVYRLFSHINRKTGAANIFAAVRFAEENGLFA